MRHTTIYALLCIGIALVLVLSVGLWGLQRDLVQNTSTLMTSVISRLQSQATRRARHLEARLKEIGEGATIGDLLSDPWIQQYWKAVTPLQDGQLYAAIVGTDGTVVYHSDPSLEGIRLGYHWYDRVVGEVGDDIVESKDNMLAAHEPSFDVHIPLRSSEKLLGEYHEGLSKNWVDQQIASGRLPIWRRWMTVIGAILSVILLSIVALYFMGRRALHLQQAVALAHLQRVTEVGQLAAGLAHEIRNPLHAIQLNLHTLRRATHADAAHEPIDVDKITRESQQEIVRIDQLLRELLGYASPEDARNEVVDACEELKATLTFLSNELNRAGVSADIHLPDMAVFIRIDKTRFRQILLNLLLNAKEAMPAGGTIHLSLRRLPQRTEILVSDEGPGIPPQALEKIFHPFYTTKSEGTGFGLAIAKRFVTEAGGSIACVSNGRKGASFRLTFPKIRKRDDTGALS